VSDVCLSCGPGERSRGPYRKSKTIQQRFDEKISPEPMSGCWLWIGAVNNKGYGVLNRCEYPLRGAVVCALHKCDNPACVNPQHLWVGSKQDNTRDMVSKGRARGWPRGLPTWDGDRRLTIKEARSHAS